MSLTLIKKFLSQKNWRWDTNQAVISTTRESTNFGRSSRAIWIRLWSMKSQSTRAFDLSAVETNAFPNGFLFVSDASGGIPQRIDLLELITAFKTYHFGNLSCKKCLTNKIWLNKNFKAVRQVPLWEPQLKEAKLEFSVVAASAELDKKLPVNMLLEKNCIINYYNKIIR